MSASTARIYVNVDERLKQNTQRVFNEMGMDMTTAITLFLKTVEREECIPFNIRTGRAYYNDLDHARICKALEQAERETADPNTKWLSHEEIMANAAKRREERKRVHSDISAIV
ncbi:MAG: type II toxin-antitoxin system RelB/DinJ family antitoxin [Defluviitaleaceae bacterium]|nr:type II toxin-antitoxin system RelB/DinJ family antitoxin [Defluviitaleaceae bacterium]